MSSSRIVFLMYHELEIAGRKLSQSESGYVRYILPLDTFRRQMAWIKESGWRGLNVGEALRYPAEPGVCITFDDGCETDLIAAAPVLREFGFNATVYLTAGFLGTPGYLSAAQARALVAQGFQIGCHSMTHPYLSDLTEPELKREVVDAKLQIEAIVGHPIEHFSCPGGRYDQRTLQMARHPGFATVANSKFYANSSSTSPYELGRVAVLRDLTIEEVGAGCPGPGLWGKDLHTNAPRSGTHLAGANPTRTITGARFGWGTPPVTPNVGYFTSPPASRLIFPSQSEVTKIF